jgi:flavin-binding protein dodecin
MTGHIYKVEEVVGTSEAGVSQAVEAAINRASQTLKGLDWFEVAGVRGSIKDGRVAEYQVTVKIGFRLMTEEELERA